VLLLLARSGSLFFSSEFAFAAPDQFSFDQSCSLFLPEDADTFRSNADERQVQFIECFIDPDALAMRDGSQGTAGYPPAIIAIANVTPIAAVQTTKNTCDAPVCQKTNLYLIQAWPGA
jgi:hypothetical protein